MKVQVFLGRNTVETLEKLKELMDKAYQDSQKLFEKGTNSRGREARKALSEISKLCKIAREEVLKKMKESKGE